MSTLISGIFPTLMTPNKPKGSEKRQKRCLFEQYNPQCYCKRQFPIKRVLWQ